ncbi:MAG: DUF126 domain-containing protein [Pseudomonadota bacterium]
MTWLADPLIDGTASGPALRLDQPISFWGGVDPADGRITRPDHPQHGACVSGMVLVIERLIGSSSSSAVMLELLRCGQAPCALIVGARDAILPIGVLVAGQMGWATIPVLHLADPPFRTGDILTLCAGGHIERA